MIVINAYLTNKGVCAVFKTISTWSADDQKKVAQNSNKVYCLYHEEVMACITDGLDPSRTIELQQIWNAEVSGQDDYKEIRILCLVWKCTLVPYGLSEGALCWMKASLSLYVDSSIKRSNSI